MEEKRFEVIVHVQTVIRFVDIEAASADNAREQALQRIKAGDTPAPESTDTRISVVKGIPPFPAERYKAQEEKVS